ncbi:MAG: glutaminase A [Blastocatellia bacterium]|nr:glutaminase A [Blastocatellia bacterium]
MSDSQSLSEDINKQAANSRDERELRLFLALDKENRGFTTPQEIKRSISHTGISLSDLRLKESIKALQAYSDTDKISYPEFCQIIRPNIALIEQTLQANLIIPEFSATRRIIEQIFENTKTITEGTVASYIPQLARVNPEQYAVSLCTIDGQQAYFGDYQTDFCIQSCSKPINYCLALEEQGENIVHKYVGREPSGRGFNELTLNYENKPHNPMINSGAIMCCSLIKPQINIADRFDYVMEQWKAICGGAKVGFSNAVYLSERATADRNFAIGYFIRENKAFPENTDLIATLEFYFQCCSIEVNAQQMSVVAATLANGGVCPITGNRIFTPKTVQHCLSLMSSCGLYDFSGEFAFTVGLPAKSGVSGAIMIVVPNVMGLCTWSPRVDRQGNSVRGLAFCKKLVEVFNFHNYDNLTGVSEKIDPRRNRLDIETDRVIALIWAASKGDLTAIQRLVARGVDINGADYDGRTPLHLAASEGHAHIVKYLLGYGANTQLKDRWGNTAIDDAANNQHQEIISLLKQ